MHSLHDPQTNTRAHFNSDLSGDVVFNLNGIEAVVPAALVKLVVARWVLSEQIEALEQAGTEAILLGLVKPRSFLDKLTDNVPRRAMPRRKSRR